MAAPAFSERELQIMGLAWQCFDEQPKINYEKLAELAGMTNPKSASNAWANIKKKLVANNSAEGSSTPKIKATPKKRGKKAADEDDDEGTPAKKKRGSAKKVTKKSATPEEEADDAAGEEDGARVKGETADDELV